ncbi:MAG: hypothetical protein SFY56_09460 [Bacteroidota bacterium]|nr:hypothetical protein [Bacteroidota bacterium]
MIFKKTYLVILVLGLFYFLPAFSQTTTVIKVKKQNELVYFYQKGIKSDTLSVLKNNLFYFVLNDSLKLSTQLLLENATCVKTDNDSIIKIIFMPGLKYEAKYTKDKFDTSKGLKFVSLINGTTTFDKNQILIQVVSTLKNEPLIENKFYYKN